MKMGRVGCPETSVRNYHYSLRNNPEQRSSHPPRGGILKSRTVGEEIKQRLWLIWWTMLSTLSGRSEDKYLLPLPAIEPQFIGRPADSLITMPVFPKQNYVEPSGLAERRFGFPCKLWKFRGTFGTRRRSFWVPIQIVEIPWNLRDSQNVVLGSDANCGNSVEPSGLAERRFGFRCKLWKFRGTFGARRTSFWVPMQIVETENFWKQKSREILQNTARNIAEYARKRQRDPHTPRLDDCQGESFKKGICPARGHGVEQLVEPLHKPEGRGCDSRWCQQKLSLTYFSGRAVA